MLSTGLSRLRIGGASTSVFVASGVIGDVFAFNPKWLGLLLSMVVAFTGITMLPRHKWRIVTLVLAFLNGTLIYAQATGFNTFHQAVPSVVPVDKQSVHTKASTSGRQVPTAPLGPNKQFYFR
jgi:hypothetical protein